MPEQLLAAIQGLAREHPLRRDPQALARLFAEVWLLCGETKTPLSQSDLESIFEFIRMLQTPGPHDENVRDFIRNHLLDPELRAQRGQKIN